MWFYTRGQQPGSVEQGLVSLVAGVKDNKRVRIAGPVYPKRGDAAYSRILQIPVK